MKLNYVLISAILLHAFTAHASPNNQTTALTVRDDERWSLEEIIAIGQLFSYCALETAFWTVLYTFVGIPLGILAGCADGYMYCSETLQENFCVRYCIKESAMMAVAGAKTIPEYITSSFTMCIGY